MLTIIALTVLGVLILAEGILGKKSWHLPTILVGLPVTLVLALYGWNRNIHYYNNMLIVDNSSIAFSAVLMAPAAPTVMMTSSPVNGSPVLSARRRATVWRTSGKPALGI